MNILINILVGLGCLIFGYIFGSIPTAVLYGKIFHHVDIRTIGSGNAGGTNVKRTWGKRAGNTVIIIDFIKTFIPFVAMWAILTYVPFNGKPLMQTTGDFYLNHDNNYIINFPIYWICIIGAIIGHCWPVFAGFKGGKGAAGLIGTICLSSWLIGFLPMIPYIFIRKKSRMVSLSVLTTTLFVVIVSWIYSILFLTHVIPANLYWLPGYGPMFNIPLYYSLTITILYVIVFIRHKENIKRLLKGEERTMTVGM